MRRFDINWGSIIKGAGYAAFFLAALAVFAYARFPSSALEAALNRAADDFLEGAKVTDARLSFPPGIRIGAASLPISGGGTLAAGPISVKPLYLPIVMGGLGADVSAGLLGGEAWIRGKIAGKEREEISVKIRMEGIDPGNLEVWEGFPWGRLSGKVSAEGALSIVEGDLFKSRGKLSATLSEGMLTLSGALLSGSPEIGVESGRLDISYDSGRLTIEEGGINGPQLSASVAGDVILSRNPRFSRLNLEARMKLDGGLKERLGSMLYFFEEENGEAVIKIGGTPDSPTIR
ncbi:MAG: type II secretion system protein GspN [Candidatus Nitrospinota bacterium M3_3B_026]